MLRPTKKLKKKEIKEDPLVTAYVRVQKFLRSHARELNIGITVLLIVVIVGVLMVRSKKRSEIAAAGQLSMAEQYYHAGEYEQAIPELSRVADTYSGTHAAGKAVFFVANAYFHLEDYTNAEIFYRRYADEYTDLPLFGASSLAGVAACLESSDSYAEAAEWYEKAAVKYPDGFDAPFLLKHAGRCFRLAGDRINTVRVYQTILDEYPDSSVRQDVGFLLESMSGG